MTEGVRLERSGRHARLVVDRPSARNAIDRSAMRQLAEHLDVLEADEELAAVIVTAAGDHFVSGGDLKDLAEILQPEQGRAMSEQMGGLLDRLHALPCPTIAAIAGDAYGGGCELAVACDLRVMARGAKMAFRQTAMGLTPGWGGGQRLARLVGRSRALLLLATADPIGAERALEIGLVDVIADDARSEAESIASRIDKRSIRAVRACKRAVDVGLDMPMREAVRFERDRFAETWGSPEHRAAVERFLESRKRS